MPERTWDPSSRILSQQKLAPTGFTAMTEGSILKAFEQHSSSRTQLIQHHILGITVGFEIGFILEHL